MSSNLALGFSEFNLRMDNPPVQKIYESEDFRFDAEHLMLYRRGEPIPLAPKAAETLLIFIERRCQILSKEELIEQIWPGAFVEESNLYLYLSVLRKTLGNQKSGTPYLETLRRRGYRFDGSVQLISDGSREEPHSAPVQVIEPIDSFRSATTDSLSVNDLPTDSSVWRQTNPAVNDLPESRRDWPLRRSSFAAIGVIALVAALALSYTYFFSRRSINSIAVMPFANESGNADLEYLSDGMTETLIASLSKLPDLQVKASSSVFRYKGSTDTQTIGKELNARAVLYGRVVQRGEDLVLHVELVDAQTENSLWGQTYNKKLSNLIALQGEVARDLVRELSLKPSGADKQKLAKNYTENVEAYKLFLNGRFHHRKLTPPEIKKGIAYLQQAIDTDPSYALAYTEISRAYTALALAGDMNPGEVLLKAKAAAQRAVEIDDGLADTFVKTGQLNESRAILNEMLRLSESRWVPPYHIALVYNALGETDQALAWLEKGYQHRDPKMALLKEERWKNLRGDPRFQDLLRRVGF